MKDKLDMYDRSLLYLVTLAGALCLPLGASAQDATKYPDWSGHWRSGPPNRWDPTKPGGLAQQAPLTPEYQKVFEDSIADQAAGGPGNDPSTWCFPAGLPRMMTAIFSIEFIILPGLTHILSETHAERRIYTDGRTWPADLETQSSFPATRSASGSSPTKTAASKSFRSRPEGSGARAIMSRPVCRCISTTRV